MGNIGSSIANSMAEKQKAVQVEMQEKMVQNQKKQGERMKRMQIATQVAIARERFWWMAGFHGFISTGLLAGLIKKKPIHPGVILPYT